MVSIFALRIQPWKRINYFKAMFEFGKNKNFPLGIDKFIFLQFCFHICQFFIIYLQRNVIKRYKLSIINKCRGLDRAFSSDVGLTFPCVFHVSAFLHEGKFRIKSGYSATAVWSGEGFQMALNAAGCLRNGSATWTMTHNSGDAHKTLLLSDVITGHGKLLLGNVCWV